MFEILEHLPLTWDGSLHILRGHRLDFTNNDVFLSLNIVLTLANSVDLDEL